MHPLKGRWLVVDEKRLAEALDKGGVRELPPNVPPGFLGERGMNMSKTDDFKPTLSAGIVQERSSATRQLTMILLYLLVVTSPIAAWMLWRGRSPLWFKVAMTVSGIAIYGLLLYLYS